MANIFSKPRPATEPELPRIILDTWNDLGDYLPAYADAPDGQQRRRHKRAAERKSNSSQNNP